MSSPFNRIIIAYDNSHGSNKALEFAKGFKKDNPELNLIVAHVVEEEVENKKITDEKVAEPIRVNGYLTEGIQLPPASLNGDRFGSSTHAKITNSVDQAFYNAKAVLATQNIHADYRTLEGRPAETLCDLAETEQADLLIVGESGHSGIKQMLLGSISEQIAKKAPCPVLIAR
ncbi:universal stress protein [Mesobacillus harenae]|uniref:universal stress protein n=1 Tax=Mesobacillus harenae TaxID=2213203 RepID=UPI001580A707|nr:universal stress protein [Mesobacillus harenae]